MLKRRIAGVSSAVGIIRVGASSRAEEYYLKLKAEDGKYAAQAALRGGYVKGGGLCLKEIAEKLKDNDLLKSAILAPYNKIQADFDNKLNISDDIIDPTEAVYYAVENAVDIVSNLITVDGLTVEIEETYYGDGEFAIARALIEMVINDKKNKGILKENEEEIHKDELMAEFGVEKEEDIRY
jgi:chaperonin GroEL (HSP60 family)